MREECVDLELYDWRKADLSDPVRCHCKMIFVCLFSGRFCRLFLLDVVERDVQTEHAIMLCLLVGSSKA